MTVPPALRPPTRTQLGADRIQALPPRGLLGVGHGLLNTIVLPEKYRRLRYVIERRRLIERVLRISPIDEKLAVVYLLVAGEVSLVQIPRMSVSAARRLLF